jgi:hypothetical protein
MMPVGPFVFPGRRRVDSDKQVGRSPAREG